MAGAEGDPGSTSHRSSSRPLACSVTESGWRVTPSSCTAAGESTPLDDGSFDAAVMVHVGMNLPEKTAVFAEVHRLLRPGGGFALYEQVRTGEGNLPYPLPWAEDERSSFVETVADYRAHLEAAGFEVEDASKSAHPPPSDRLRRGRSATPSLRAAVRATHRQQGRRDEGGSARRLAVAGSCLSPGGATLAWCRPPGGCDQAHARPGGRPATKTGSHQRQVLSAGTRNRCPIGR